MGVAALLPLVTQAEPSGVPAYVLAVPDYVEQVLIAETDTSTLHRYSVTDGTIELIDQRYMSVGSNGVGKQRAWDRRTPLGVYFITEQLDTTGLPDKYGVTAFPLDYPNGRDRQLGRTGDGIWIHGVPPGGERRPPLDTDGCIALPNEDLLDIAGDLRPLITPVVITRALQRTNKQELATRRDELRQALDRWRQSYADGNIHQYLSLYAADFRYRELSRDEWMALRVRRLQQYGSGDVRIDHVAIFADPEEPGLYLSRFRETVVRDGRPVRMTKRLYWREYDDAGWQIVAEDNG